MISGVLAAVAVARAEVRRHKHNVPVAFFHALNGHVAGRLRDACTDGPQDGGFDGVNVPSGIDDLRLRVNNAADGLLYGLRVRGRAGCHLEMRGVQSLQKLLLARVRGRAGEVVDSAHRALVGVLKQPDHALRLCKLNACKPVFNIEIAVIGNSLDTGVFKDALDLRVRCLCPALDFPLYGVQMAARGLINLKLPFIRGGEKNALAAP